MSLFSERKGYVPPRERIQRESIDDALKTAIWNKLYQAKLSAFDTSSSFLEPHNGETRAIATRLWKDLFNWPLNNIPEYRNKTLDEIRRFYTTCEWYKVFDFIEFMVVSKLIGNKKSFCNKINDVLEKNLSAYRLVNNQIIEITDDAELKEIEEAFNVPIAPVSNHIQQATELLFDRHNPDFRNSVKESVSAVEALCKVLAGKDSITLGAAIKKIEKQGKIEINSAFKQILTSIWAYSSNNEGIRHARKLGEKSNLTFEESKFFLVTCSALVNYLSAKAIKAGMVLQ